MNLTSLVQLKLKLMILSPHLPVPSKSATSAAIRTKKTAQLKLKVLRLMARMRRQRSLGSQR